MLPRGAPRHVPTSRTQFNTRCRSAQRGILYAPPTTPSNRNPTHPHPHHTTTNTHNSADYQPITPPQPPTTMSQNTHPQTKCAPQRSQQTPKEQPPRHTKHQQQHTKSTPGRGRQQQRRATTLEHPRTRPARETPTTTAQHARRQQRTPAPQTPTTKRHHARAPEARPGTPDMNTSTPPLTSPNITPLHACATRTTNRARHHQQHTTTRKPQEQTRHKTQECTPALQTQTTTTQHARPQTPRPGTRDASNNTHHAQASGADPT